MVRDRADFLVLVGGALGFVLLCAVLAYGQPQGNWNGGGGQGGYQRNRNDEWRGGHDRRRDDFKGNGQWRGPQVSSSWYQRPYPYHLDYYKMKWGGSYAPYFGNLYGVPFGTPQVVNGNWGDGGGNWGGGGGYPMPGYEWMDGPRGRGPGAGVIFESEAAAQPVEVQPNGEGAQRNGESLPVPVK